MTGRALLLPLASISLIGGLWLSGCGESDTPRANERGARENLATGSNLPPGVSEKADDEQELPDLSFGASRESSDGRQTTDRESAPVKSPTAANPQPSAAQASDALSQGNNTDDGFLPVRRLGPLELVDVSSERLAAAGLKVQESDHLRLIFEPAIEESIADYGVLFDQAVDQWVRYFQADPGRFEDWKVTCFHIVDESRFRKAELMPPDQFLPGGKLPPGGWEYGNQIWLNQHPGDYYGRHQLLHEGTHAFCHFNFGTLGPPWLAEGLAEFLAVHRWKEGRLEMAARVTDKTQLEYWGRVKLIQEAWYQGQPKQLAQVMAFPPQAFPATDAYAWSWAAVSMMSQNPNYSQGFQELVQELSAIPTSEWNDRLREALPRSVGQQETEWQVAVREMDYGYDFARSRIQWSTNQAIPGDELVVELPADGAWLETDLILETGAWKVHCEGRYQITIEEQTPVMSESPGISLAYANGSRLGQVQAAIASPEGFFQASSPLTRPVEIGSRTQWQVNQGGRLYLRVNDDPTRLDDNQGTVTVGLKKLP